MALLVTMAHPRPTSRPTLRHIAEAAGVSIRTVSVILNEASDIATLSPATIGRVRAEAARLNYVPSTAGRLLRTGRSRCVGLLFGDNTTPLHLREGRGNYGHELILGATSAAIERRHHLTLFTAWSEPVTQRADLAHLGLVDGLVVLARDFSEDLACAPLLREWGRPVAYALHAPPDAAPDHLQCVRDHAQGFALLASELRARGLRTARLVNPPRPKWAVVNQPIEHAFNDACAAHGLALLPTVALDELPSLGAHARPGDTLIGLGEQQALAAADLVATRPSAWPAVPLVVAVTREDEDGYVPPHLQRCPCLSFPIGDIARRATLMLLDTLAGQPPAERVQRIPYRFHAPA